MGNGQRGDYHWPFGPVQTGPRGRPLPRPRCTCPHKPYNPRQQPETDPGCPSHGRTR